MNRIDELIKKLCPNGVEYRPIWSLTAWDKKFNGVDKEKQKKVISYKYYLSTDFTKVEKKNGNIKYISTGISGDDRYTTEKLAGDYIADGEVVCIPWGGTPNVKYHKGKFVTGDNRIATSLDINILSNKFLYYWMQSKINVISKFYRGSGIKHPSMKDVLDMNIAVPPLEVQCEIVHILDDFTLLSAELSAELKARQKQFSYYRECLVNNGGHKIRLDKIVDIYLGLTHTPKYVTSGIKFISAQNTSKDYLDLTNVKYISREEYESITQNAKPKKGDILFTRVGSNLGHPVIVDTDEELCMFVSLGYLRVKDTSKVSIDYIKHWINTENFWNQVRKNVHGSAKVNLNTGWLSKFEISIPNFDEQKKIVNILNVLEKLCNDISEGLPAEIEARKKQYEYYRDKLLTFKELKVNE